MNHSRDYLDQWKYIQDLTQEYNRLYARVMVLQKRMEDLEAEHRILRYQLEWLKNDDHEVL